MSSSWLPRPSRRYPLLLLLAIVVPYAPLATMRGVIITDDYFTSDIANGELPMHVAAGNNIRRGEPPTWSPDVCSGYPLLPAGGAEPLSLSLFSVFPKTIAVNLLLLGLLAIAALGAYAYARCIGSSRTGAWLTGFTFAYSGFFVCHLKHLGFLTCVAWFPWALLFLECAIRPSESAGGKSSSATTAGFMSERLLPLGGFALALGLQLLAGFPQAVYIASLAYLIYCAAHLPGLLWRRTRWTHLLALVGGLAAAGLVGIGLGAVQLVPQWELSQFSHRVGKLDLGEAAHVAFWRQDLWTFLSPYINGDISNLTYKGWGRSVFWEDYGYVGIVTLLLGVVAVYGAFVRGFRRLYVSAWIVLGVFSLLMVVSLVTPVFKLAHRFLPGMNMFRFPTRFMFVVACALAVLAGIGLTKLEEGTSALAKRLLKRAPSALWVALPLLALSVADLVYHQRRQNPIVDAERWFSAPVSAQLILDQPRPDGPAPLRVYTVDANASHERAFKRARGWSGDLGPYIAQRDFLQVNSNIIWGLATPNCYVGLEPRWIREFWGPFGTITSADPRSATYARLLAFWNVRYLVLPWPVNVPGELRFVGRTREVFVYEVQKALPRAYVVPSARFYRNRRQVEAQLFAGTFDPTRELWLPETDRGAVSAPRRAPRLNIAQAPPSSVRIEDYRATSATIRATSPSGGFLVLADTWYPGWVAEVDGRAVPILNANLGQRAVELEPGEHRVRFSFRSRSVRGGAAASGLALLAIIAGGWVGLRRRARSERS